MSPQTLIDNTSAQDDDRTETASPIAPGTKDLNSKHDTVVLGKNRALRAMLDKPSSTSDDTALPKKEVTLLIRGMSERVILSTEPAILGRMEMETRGFQPDIDLSPYGAKARGVSRVHARLSLHDDTLYITDLYSTNGTFVDGNRLEENIPFQLNNGVEVLLGSLLVQVIFD